VGDVATGIELLGDLYVATDDPVYIHNQGRCYQQNGQPEKAIPRFEEYLRKATDITSSERATVDGYISECHAKLDRAHLAQEPSQPQIPAPPAVESVQAKEPATLPITSPRSSTTMASSGSGWRTGAIVSVCTGVAAVGVGVVFNVMERNLHSEMSTDVATNTPDNESRRARYETVSLVGYATGAAALATAAALYWVGAQWGNSPEGRVALTPVVGTSAVTLVLNGAY
jgi:hypothetical protein